MGTDNIFKKKKEARKKEDLKRKEAQRTSPPRILLCCEGEQTEVLYFKSFRIPTLHVKGFGRNTVSLVDEAIRLKQEAQKSLPYDQVWCVFDKDSFKSQQFNAAVQKAKAFGMSVAYTNEAFELWFLLHFDYHDVGISRSQYEGKLTEKLGRKYKKNDPKMYATLFDRQLIAMNHAKNLLASYKIDNPAQNNPSTTVHELVYELNKHVK